VNDGAALNENGNGSMCADIQKNPGSIGDILFQKIHSDGNSVRVDNSHADAGRIAHALLNILSFWPRQPEPLSIRGCDEAAENRPERFRWDPECEAPFHM
jgi:hypothetical protein